MPDYSSQSYWQSRLLREDSEGFEWLVSSEEVLPHLATVFSQQPRTPLRILHFGCGSSTLGSDIQQRFGDRAEVYDADYAISNTQRAFLSRTTEPLLKEVPVLHVDALNLADLIRTQPEGGWDILIDKSTADAIACGEPLTGKQDNGIARETSEPIELLCLNLNRVARPGAIWLCISYSSSRFDFLRGSEREYGWHVRTKDPIHHTSSWNSEEPVHRPDTCMWVWLLDRA